MGYQMKPIGPEFFAIYFAEGDTPDSRFTVRKFSVSPWVKN